MSRPLVLTSKTGFQVIDVFKPVNIRDERGILFYTTEPMLPRVTHFNLPAGRYIVDSGFFRELQQPNEVRLSSLPFPERFYPSTKDFKLIFGNNPNKCTVFWDAKTIVMDRQFLNRPLPEIDLILFHEEGHSRYKTEKYADLYATNAMLKKGYNESQIGLSHLNSLSSAQYERKEYINKKIINRNAY